MAAVRDRPGRFTVMTRRKLELGANVKAIKGTQAAIATEGSNAGYVVPMSAAEGLLPIGRFTETVDNTGGALGAKKAEVAFHRTIECLHWTNDSGGSSTPVTKAMRGTLCFAKDNDTVSGSGTGRSFAGFVWDIVDGEVLVETLPGLMTAVAMSVAATLFEEAT